MKVRSTNLPLVVREIVFRVHTIIPLYVVHGLVLKTPHARVYLVWKFEACDSLGDL